RAAASKRCARISCPTLAARQRLTTRHPTPPPAPSSPSTCRSPSPPPTPPPQSRAPPTGPAAGVHVQLLPGEVLQLAGAGRAPERAPAGAHAGPACGAPARGLPLRLRRCGLPPALWLARAVPHRHQGARAGAPRGGAGGAAATGSRLPRRAGARGGFAGPDAVPHGRRRGGQLRVPRQLQATTAGRQCAPSPPLRPQQGLGQQRQADEEPDLTL
ncbi:hypothetical protein CFC21_028751, partial [Triticum aestivum]